MGWLPHPFGANPIFVLGRADSSPPANPLDTAFRVYGKYVSLIIWRNFDWVPLGVRGFHGDATAKAERDRDGMQAARAEIAEASRDKWREIEA